MKQHDTPPPSKAISYTVEHITMHTIYGAGNWYRLKLNYPDVELEGRMRKIRTRFSLFDDEAQVRRFVARWHPDLPAGAFIRLLHG